jgi:DNA repair protein RadC
MRKTIKRVSLKMVREQSVSYETEPWQNPLTNKNSVTPIAEKYLKDSAIERFIAIGLDISNKPNVFHIFDGGVNQCITSPGTIFKVLLLANCVSFIVAHNHPGNTLVGSGMDISLSRKLRKVSDLLEIKMLDSIIYNADCSLCTSLRETNYTEIWI